MKSLSLFMALPRQLIIRVSQLAVIVAIGVLISVPAESQTFYENDFQSQTYTGWATIPNPGQFQTAMHSETAPLADVNGTPRRFLGRFGNQEDTLTIETPEGHTEIVVEFDLYVIASWDGNYSSDPLSAPDLWRMGVMEKGQYKEYYKTSFASYYETQAYPSQYVNVPPPTFPNYPFNTAATEVNTLGYGVNGGSKVRDAVYHISLTIPHTDSILQILMAADLKDVISDTSNESWGIDNITIRGQCAEPIYTNGFGLGNYDGWTTTVTPNGFQGPMKIDTTPVDGRKFLGPFGTQSIYFTLKNLPPDGIILVNLELFVINSWDGNGYPNDPYHEGPDIWSFARYGISPAAFSTTFSYSSRRYSQSFPYQFGERAVLNNAAASEINTLGYFSMLNNYEDAVYHIRDTIHYTGSDVTLEFSASLNSSLPLQIDALKMDESWGIDTITISTLKCCEPSTSSPVKTSLSLVHFGRLTICEGNRDTSIWIRNISCDTIQLSDLQIQGSGYYFDFNGSTMLPPESSTVIGVRFVSSSPGSYDGILRFTVNRNGIAQSREVLLKAEVVDSLPQFTLQHSLIFFPDLSICSDDSLDVRLHVVGCDSTRVEFDYVGDDGFTLTGLSPGLFGAVDSAVQKIRLNPVRKGLRTGTLKVRATRLKDSLIVFDTIISVSANITDGSRALAVSTDSVDFGTTTICEEREWIVNLLNTGCDTLTLIGASISPGFMIPDWVDSIRIPPNGSIPFRISTQLDTSGHPSEIVGSLKFETNGLTKPSISLRRGVRYPLVPVTLSLSKTSANEGDTVELIVNLADLGQPISSVTFTIGLNTDLLGIDTVSSPFKIDEINFIAVTPSVSEITYRVSAQTLDQEIARLKLLPYLTSDSITQIQLMNLRLNDSDTLLVDGCLEYPMGEPGSRFTILYNCGDATIRNVMAGLGILLTISDIVPNPASDELLLRGKSLETDLEVEIWTLGGELAIKEHATVVPGTYGISLNTSALSSGNYFVVLRSPGIAVTRQFQILR